ncbi:of growth 1-like [Octopus vulgaris]|uniref:Of growth 1-like n=3 Tax=Octopus TaxID=6643 RepID=A0AA36BCT8_OCTVU|nr:inhibitor of growth protein 1 isoform X1 [Octopus sinensis]CAI9732033.1 of growth 1-like [Octopus vulgaris]
MTTLNQAAVEALCSATYLQNYLDIMDNLPDDLQRKVTQLRELDSQCKEIMQDINRHHLCMYEADGPAKRKSFIIFQRALLRFQEIGDEKLNMMTLIIDLIENRSRQLEQDRENLDPSLGKDNDKEDLTNAKVKQENDRNEKAGSKRQRRQKTHDISKDEEKKEEKDRVPRKKKKRKTKKEKESEKSPIDPPIDPDEPTYCECNQVSYGEMIGCDNDLCPIEWFHFSCVNLTSKPKGKWYCPKCRGDKSNVKRQDK